MTTLTRQASKGIVVLRAFFCVSLVLFTATHAHAQSGRGGGGQRRPSGPGTGNPDEPLVPWKFVEKGAAVEKGSLTLYWLPASQKEMEGSALLSSRALLESSLRCVAFQIVLPENAATIALLGSTGKLPAALLVNGQGNVIRRIENVRGSLPPASVERMVSDELAARDEAMYHAMSDARKRASAGEKDAAIDLYKTVWNDRCFFPLAGTEAQRALKALGVEVHDVAGTVVVDPQLSKPSLPSKPPAPGGKADHHGR
jgi:hypothetical protein